jgi:iron complex transport system ATP-binding protein
MTSLLEARAIAIHQRLEPTDLNVDAGQLVAIIGPNGGGKTSLLRALAGIETGGSVRIGGEDVGTLPSSRLPRILTFMPASRGLVWPISVRDVIALGSTRLDSDRVDELIELLELGPLADRPADRLSTGERARVLFARALAPRPRLLLLDEPLSNLDPYWVLRMLEILRQTVTAGSTALVSLHDIDRIGAFDRTLLISGGGLRADLDPEEMLGSPALADAFRIEHAAPGWKLRRPEDPRSSP